MAAYQSGKIQDCMLSALCLAWLLKKEQLPEGSGILGLVVEGSLGLQERRIIHHAINTLPEEARSYPRSIIVGSTTIIPADDLKLGSLTKLETALHEMRIVYHRVPWRFSDQYLPDILGIRI